MDDRLTVVVVALGIHQVGCLARIRKGFLKKREVSKSKKLCSIGGYFSSILIYSSESWTFTQERQKQTRGQISEKAKGEVPVRETIRKAIIRITASKYSQLFRTLRNTDGFRRSTKQKR